MQFIHVWKVYSCFQLLFYLFADLIYIKFIEFCFNDILLFTWFGADIKLKLEYCGDANLRQKLNLVQKFRFLYDHAVLFTTILK